MDHIKIRFGSVLQKADAESGNLSENMFQHSFNPMFSFAERIWKPHMDIFETQSEIIIHAEIAGVKKEDLEIEIFDNAVKINGKRLEAQSTPNATYRLVEIQHGSFERTLRLPSKIDVENVKATYADGMLQIAMTKSSTELKYSVPVSSD